MTIAFAVTRDEFPQVFVAEDEHVLARVVALRLVATTRASELSAGTASSIREALLDERWADAIAAWMGATGVIVDIYPDETLWSDALLDEERTSLELRVSPIFEDPQTD